MEQLSLHFSFMLIGSLSVFLLDLLVRDIFGLSFGNLQVGNLHEKAEPESMETEEDAQEDVIDLVKRVHLWIKLVREDSVNKSWKDVKACPDPGENHACKEREGITVIVFVHRR